MFGPILSLAVDRCPSQLRSISPQLLLAEGNLCEGRDSFPLRRQGFMKRTVQSTTADSPDAALAGTLKKEGSNGSARIPEDLTLLLRSLQTMRDGDFSVRLPGHWTGVAGKIADTFNEIVTANQQIAQELKRAGQVVGKEGRTRERTRFHQSKGAWGEMETSVNRLVDDLLRPTTDVTRAATGG